MSTARRAVAGIRDLLPARGDYPGLRGGWPRDLVAGVTVAVVALPLALGFGIAAGLGPEAGLITAIVAGVVAAVFGGSAVQVSGPTGAMAVVLLPIVDQHGAGAVAIVGLMAGALIVGAGVLRLGRFLAHIPWPVIEGFTVGIAAIILLQQIPAALGVARPEGENTALVAARALAGAGALSPATLALTVLTAAVMLLVMRVRRALPAALAAVVAATVVAEAGGLGVDRVGALPGALPMPALPALPAGGLEPLIGAALAVAALAAIESLLSARVADGMTPERRPHDPDRELVGQGLANLAAPLCGGMPATGAIARTAVNVRAGARTRASAVIHSVVLAAVVLAGAGLVARIPLAALAAVLMVTALRMVERRAVTAILRSSRADAAVLVATATATIAFDLIIAIELGLVVAAVLALRALARSSGALPSPVGAASPADDRIAVYRLDGALFFGAAQRFVSGLTDVGPARVVILRLPGLRMVDASGAQALGRVVETLQARGVTVLLKGPRPEHMRVLRAVGVLDRLAGDDRLFARLDDALDHARRHLAAEVAPAR